MGTIEERIAEAVYAAWEAGENWGLTAPEIAKAIDVSESTVRKALNACHGAVPGTACLSTHRGVRPVIALKPTDNAIRAKIAELRRKGA